MTAGEVRVFAFARQIRVTAAAVLAAGRILGIDVPTPLSAVSAADRASLEAHSGPALFPGDVVRYERCSNPCPSGLAGLPPHRPRFKRPGP